MLALHSRQPGVSHSKSTTRQCPKQQCIPRRVLHGRSGSRAGHAGRVSAQKQDDGADNSASVKVAEKESSDIKTEMAGNPEDIKALAASVQKQRKRTKVESTDAVATFMTRRFGLAGGFAWLAILAVGSLGEQVKTRLEVAAEEAATKDVVAAPEVVLPSGVRYQDQRVGGGQYPIRGYLMVVDYTLTVGGQVVEDTRARRKPIVFLYGSRPFAGGMCPGLEEALSTMKAGGRRRVVVPAAAGFGEKGAMLRPTEHVPEKQGLVPPGAELEYDVELVRVSIPPS